MFSEPVELNPDTHERMVIRPQYFLNGFSREPRLFLQRKTCERLLAALEVLPEEYGFVVWDAYRSRECQGVMFEWMKDKVRVRNPALSEEEVCRISSKYMSPPTAVGDFHCPPHLSGGAVDLTLCDIAKGTELLMGTDFDDCSDLAHAMYYEGKEGLSDDDVCIRNNRRLLRNAMEDAGFTSYEYEWWHFDYGNCFWSRVTGKKEIFGPLFGDDDGPMDN